jgi:Protein of unknown function (DUF2630)
MSDKSISEHIKELVDEEQRLWAQDGVDDQGRRRQKQIKVELDQCWDLLRQRRAREEFGEDPDKAEVRPPKVVERYKQ